MARKKDLAGLATLAGLAYMASRDKEGKGSMPSASTAATAAPAAAKEDSAMSSDLGEIRDEEGTLSKLRRNTETGEMYDPGGVGSTTPARAAVRTPATRAIPKATSAPRDDQYNPGVKQRLKDDQYNPDVKVRTKAAYETPYDRMNRMNREEAKAKAEAEKSRSSTPGRGVIDTSRINPNTLLPYKKGGEVKKMASGGSVKGWGIARGSRKAKTY
jgi:hypothetical protein